MNRKGRSRCIIVGGARLFRKRNVLYKDRKKERRRDFNERMNGRNLGEILSTITFFEFVS